MTVHLAHTCDMTESLTEVWRACQQRVNRLERHYADMMIRYCRGEGPPPSDAMKAELAAKRAEAAEALSLVLCGLDQRMADAEDSLDDGVPGPLKHLL